MIFIMGYNICDIDNIAYYDIAIVELHYIEHY